MGGFIRATRRKRKRRASTPHNTLPPSVRVRVARPGTQEDPCRLLRDMSADVDASSPLRGERQGPVAVGAGPPRPVSDPPSGMRVILSCHNMQGLDVDSGVVVVRRDFIRLSVGAFGTLLSGACGLKHHPSRVANLSWDEFVGDLATRAEDAFCRRIGEESYVSAVVAALRRVEGVLPPSARDLSAQRRFLITEFALPPGAGFRHHDHRDYNGVILVMEGSVGIRSYELMGSNPTPPPGTEVRIRETASQSLHVGAFSTLTSVRDNIHDVRARSSGCRLIDIFTWMGPHPKSVYLDVDQVPIDTKKKVYRAVFET